MLLRTYHYEKLTASAYLKWYRVRDTRLDPTCAHSLRFDIISGMAQSSRKSHRISESPSHNPRVDDSEKDTQLRIAENDKVNEAKFVEKLERDFGKGKPLEVHMKDIKALRTFRNAFPSVKHANPENLNVYVMNEKVRPSSRLLKNVAPGGWILLPLVQANVLRGTGKYTCMGILDSEG